MIRDLFGRIAAMSALAFTTVACTQDAPRTPEDVERWSDASLWSLSVRDIDGNEVPLAKYRGKVAIVVNVASRCGFTPQYKELQALHQSMKDEDVVVLGFPCNDFGGQEPGSLEEIKSFCSTRYGVDFPMFEKVRVKPGQSQSEVYALLGTQSGKLPGWNFCKYVVGRDGRVVSFHASGASPVGEKIRADIKKALAEPAPAPEGDSDGPES